MRIATAVCIFIRIKMHDKWRNTDLRCLFESGPVKFIHFALLVLFFEIKVVTFGTHYYF